MVTTLRNNVRSACIKDSTSMPVQCSRIYLDIDTGVRYGLSEDGTCYTLTGEFAGVTVDRHWFNERRVRNIMVPAHY